MEALSRGVRNSLLDVFRSLTLTFLDLGRFAFTPFDFYFVLDNCRGLKELVASEFTVRNPVPNDEKDTPAREGPQTHLESLVVRGNMSSEFVEHVLAPRSPLDLTRLRELTLINADGGVAGYEYTEELIRRTSPMLQHLTLQYCDDITLQPMNLRSISIASDPAGWTQAFNNCNHRLERVTVELMLKYFAAVSDVDWMALDTVLARSELVNLREVTVKVGPTFEGFMPNQDAEYSFPQIAANARKNMSATNAKTVLNFETTDVRGLGVVIKCVALKRSKVSATESGRIPHDHVLRVLLTGVALAADVSSLTLWFNCSIRQPPVRHCSRMSATSFMPISGIFQLSKRDLRQVKLVKLAVVAACVVLFDFLFDFWFFGVLGLAFCCLRPFAGRDRFWDRFWIDSVEFLLRRSNTDSGRFWIKADSRPRIDIRIDSESNENRSALTALTSPIPATFRLNISLNLFRINAPFSSRLFLQAQCELVDAAASTERTLSRAVEQILRAVPLVGLTRFIYCDCISATLASLSPGRYLASGQASGIDPLMCRDLCRPPWKVPNDHLRVNLCCIKSSFCIGVKAHNGPSRVSGFSRCYKYRRRCFKELPKTSTSTATCYIGLESCAACRQLLPIPMYLHRVGWESGKHSLTQSPEPQSKIGRQDL
ncbi:hypothetical protein B0H17DRAFT_1182626 [Mycena rosella]|uniref:Uncharacterized protein n=1 Tax=Mycena rosella TaxID=1033263 RepID=A0AAD7GAU6_MYCRO|nr:hypothetical protein B0H17DRAFT_1182626 [Mycena rosella]